MTTSNKKATVNFSNMSEDAFKLLSACQMHIVALAEAERHTDKVKKELKARGFGGKVLQEMCASDREAEKRERVATTTMCEAFVIRHMTTEDITSKDFDPYHIDWVDFLRTIGVVSAGEVDTKATHKIKAIMSTAVDRYNVKAAGRRRGGEKFTGSERKDVKNNIIDLVAAFIAAAVDSGAIEHHCGSLAKVDFSAKQEAEKQAEAKQGATETIPEVVKEEIAKIEKQEAEKPKATIKAPAAKKQATTKKPASKKQATTKKGGKK